MAKVKIENLVVAVDLSEYSKLVVKEAQALSETMKWPLSFVYVCADFKVSKAGPHITKGQLSEFYDDEIRETYGLSQDATVIVKFGKPFEKIIEVAQKISFPLLVAGYRGQHAFLRYFLGSTVERLALQGEIPIWVHRGEKVVLPQKILIPCDLTPRAEKTINEVEEFSASVKAEYELFHVKEEPLVVADTDAYSVFYAQIREVEEQNISEFKKKYPDLKTLDAFGDVTGKICDRAKKFDVIALSPRRGKKSAPYFGSVTAHLMRESEKPLLVVP